MRSELLEEFATDLAETQELFFHHSCVGGVQELGEFYTGFEEQ